jgi:hypothetical protein
MSAQQAINMAAATSQRINSASTTMAVKVSGSTSATTTGSMQLQLKPSLLMSASLNIAAAGRTIPVDEVLGSQAVYVKVPGVSALTGKPWLKISFTQLSGKLGAAYGQLLQSMQNGNPLSQTKLFEVSKNVHATGTQVINGVQTTRYTGSYSAASARAALSPSQRKLLGSQLNSLTGDVLFTVWIDGQHHVRRVIETEHVGGSTVNTTINITAIDQPVHITLPPANQVAPLPQRLLNGAGSSGNGVL